MLVLMHVVARITGRNHADLFILEMKNGIFPQLLHYLINTKNPELLLNSLDDAVGNINQVTVLVVNLGYAEIKG